MALFHCLCGSEFVAVIFYGFLPLGNHSKEITTEEIMKKNIHPLERKIRIVVGLVLASLAFVGPANHWFLLGLIPVATGIMGWCPPYAIFGISTCPSEPK